ncbi:magnesium transporter [Euzebya sp.]|uniref:magnesium transporter n=1 Tax=Euzebya sp. TaxID=1971409 RepID=UPI003518F1FA
MERTPRRDVATAFMAAVRAALRVLQRNARLPLVREILGHWLQERSTVRQGVAALTIGITITLAAGVVLGAMDRLLEELPGLLVLAPAAIGMRGAIFGALGARLGTGMLTGELDGRVDRGSFLGQNVAAATLLSAVTAVLLAAVAKGIAWLLGLEVIAFTDLVVVSVVGAALSSLAVLGVVIALIRSAQRQRWDMDAIGTPIISATADISTLPALVVGTWAIGGEVVSAVVGWTCVALALAAAVAGLANRRETTRRIVRESLPILGYTALMGVLAGTVLEAQKERLISSAALLVAVPPFIASSGAIGGILSARLSSQLHLGLVVPRALPDRPAWMEGSLTLLFAALGYLSVGVLTHLASVALGYASPGLAGLIGIMATAGVLAMVLIFFVGYYAATSSYRFGLDPDNVGIPLVTSTMDFVGIGCLTAGILVFG